MPTPVGHALGGLLVYLGRAHLDRTLLLATLLAALAPDLDFAIGPFVGRSYHHYFTHSLGFTALFACFAYGVMRWMERTSPARDSLVMATGYLSHVMLDMLGQDAAPPFGVQLFWPLSDAFFISPVQIFMDVWRGNLGRLFGLHNWMAVGREILILAPLVAATWWLRRRRAQVE